MVEVFKTNVEDRIAASMLVNQIQQSFKDYHANFDLDDCDRILRVECQNGPVQSSFLIDLLKDFGFYAEILPDEAYPEKDDLLNEEGKRETKVPLSF